MLKISTASRLLEKLLLLHVTLGKVLPAEANHILGCKVCKPRQICK